MGNLTALLFIFIFTCVGIPSSALSTQRQKLVLSVNSTKAHEDASKQVYKAFNSLTGRFEFELLPLPPARATAMADSGQIVRRNSPVAEECVPERYRIDITDEIQGIKMLRTGRVDAVLVLNAAYYSILIDDPKIGIGLRLAKIEKPFHLYMFVHKKHKNLIPALDAEIQKAVATGKLQKALDESVQGFKDHAETSMRNLETTR